MRHRSWIGQRRSSGLFLHAGDSLICSTASSTYSANFNMVACATPGHLHFHPAPKPTATQICYTLTYP
ncbi:hypothetical protein AYI70_g6981 [Smittium culicis]|uniref:Uncharacterized protein n=1 Tax=Smittium culicis TaxID=133412 RepID=A0A1R1XMJ9_9FUNG|nr:hypothetical protein AYI70_g6981 [Smittium culicis]